MMEDDDTMELLPVVAGDENDNEEELGGGGGSRVNNKTNGAIDRSSASSEESDEDENSSLITEANCGSPRLNTGTRQSSSSPRMSSINRASSPRPSNLRTSRSDTSLSLDNEVNTDLLTGMEDTAELDNQTGNEEEEDPEMEQPSRVYALWRKVLIFLLFFIVPITIALGVVLIIDSDADCQQPIQLWGRVEFTMQSLMIIFNGLTLLKVVQYQNARTPSQRPMIWTLYIFYLLDQLLNLLWFGWFVIGLNWIFQAHTKGHCHHTAPHLFRMCLALVIIQMMIMSALFCFCCCSCLILLIKWCLILIIRRRKAPQGASHQLINSLCSKKFDPEDVDLKRDDPCCGICLCDYEIDEDVRLLPCKHYFHCACVDTWLLKNKTCPFCKRMVDEPIQTV